MLEITAILVAAAVVYGIGRATGLPVVPLLIIVGVGLTAIGAMPDREFVISILEVGLVFLVFAAGIDMSPARVGKQTNLAMKVGLIQFGALGLIAGWMVLRTGYSLEETLYVALAISASSTLVVVRLLKSRQELFESFGRMIIGVLLLQDVLVIGALVLLTALSHENPSAMLLTLEVAAGLVILTVVMGKWVLPAVVERYRGEDETLLLIVLALLFGFVGVSYMGGVPLVVGAFLAGLSLSSFPTRSLVRGLITSLSDFFLVVFFISLGALVSFPDSRILLEVLALIALVVVITPLLVAYVAEKAGMTSRGALEAGLLLAQTSEFSLIVGLQGMETGQISEDLFAAIVLVTVATMMLTPLISSSRTARWLMHFHPNPGSKSGETGRDCHVVVVGGGTAGTLLLDKLQNAGVEAVVVDHDPMIVTRFRGRDCEAVWGDGEDPQVLKDAGVDRARAVVITTGKLEHLYQVREIADPETPIWIHVFEEEDARLAEEKGARTVVYSTASADTFMEWFGQRWPADGGCG